MPYAPGYSGGVGSIADPYQITTLAQLQGVGSDLDKSFKLMNDIDASPTRYWNEIPGAPGTYYGFVPIGSISNPNITFTGTLDGNYKTISSLYINRPTGTTQNIAFFTGIGAYTGTVTIVQNLILSNIDFHGNYNIAGLVSRLDNSRAGVHVFSNVKVTGTITIEGVDSSVATAAGMICDASSQGGGYVNEQTWTNCTTVVRINSNSAMTATGTVRASGFCAVGSSYCTFTSCTSSGKINLTYIISGTGTAQATGFTQSGICVSCTSSGEVRATLTGTSTGTSNLSGFGGGGTFTKCKAYGDVLFLSTNPAYVGGFSGITSGTYTQCEAHGDVESQSTDATENVMGGFFAYTVSSGATNSFAAGDIGRTYGANANAHIGGFYGRANSAVMTRCYSVGYVTPGIAKGGGFGGKRTHTGASGLSCFFDTETSGYTDGSPTGDFDVTSTSIVGGATTVTVTKATHGYVAGNVIKISGAVPAGFNGVHIVDSVGASTIVYVDSSMNGVTASTQGTLSEMAAYGHTTTLMKTLTTFSAAKSAWDFDTVWNLSSCTRANSVGNTIWASQVDDYDNFEEGVRDSEGFSLEVPTTNTIRWIDALEALLLGTDGDEWLLMSSRLETPLTPTNFQIKQQSTFGSAAIQAVKINDVILFVDFVGRKLRELTFNGDKYVAPDLCALAEHITYPGIVGMAVQHNPDTIVWAWRSDGVLLSFTYDRSQEVMAWAKHPIDGLVQSVCVIPNATAGEDEVWLSIKRTSITSDPVYIERFWTRAAVTSIADAYFVDAGITWTGAASNTIPGLSHLEGQTVVVLGTSGATTTIYTGLVVASGIVTLPGAATVTKAQVGLPFTSKVQPMRIVMNTQGGTSMGSVDQISEIVLSLHNAAGVKSGPTDATQIAIDLTDEKLENSNTVTGLFDGEVSVHHDGGFSVSNPIIVSSNSPLPLTVRAIIARLEKTGR